MISDTLARRFWPNEDPVGKRITFYDPHEGPWMTIAGVVGDVRPEDFLAEPSGMIFEPYYQSPPLETTYLIRTRIDCRQLVPTAKRAIWDIDRDLPLYQVMTMEEVLSNSIAEPRHYMGFLTCFGMLAIFLAGAGTYAIMAQYTRQRTREIAIRFAVGATAGDITQLILRQGTSLAWKGILTGTLLSFWLTRTLANLLHGVSTTDPITFCSAASFVAIMIAFASYIPARQHLRRNLVESLRHE
jgi:putative ABC transport system permease protein